MCATKITEINSQPRHQHFHFALIVKKLNFSLTKNMNLLDSNCALQFFWQTSQWTVFLPHKSVDNVH